MFTIVCILTRQTNTKYFKTEKVVIYVKKFNNIFFVIGILNLFFHYKDS